MAKDDDNFDKSKIIAALRAKGIPDSEISKLYGPLPKVNLTQTNSTKINAYRKKNAWKYDNKHVREERYEDIDPDYEPIEELRKKPKAKKPSKPRISKKKPKPKPPKNDWNAAAEARLKALYEAGYTTGEIAKEFKTTPDAITGKLSRLRKAGWKGIVGTTHSPLPTPTPIKTPKSGSSLSPTIKKMLASALQTNFGVVGTYFSKKWGLIEKPTSRAGSKESSEEVTAAIIKSNQLILSSITKLDTTLRRGTSSLTKALSLATAKMTEAINTTTELIKKNQTTDRLGGGGDDQNSSTPTGSAGRGKGVGLIAALLGGGALAMLMSSRSEAAINPTETIPPDPIEEINPTKTEEELREKGAPPPSEDASDVEIKVKELTFEADDIIFEADSFKFTSKTSSSPVIGKTGSPNGGGSGAGPSGTESGGSPSGATSGPMSNGSMVDPSKSGGFFGGGEGGAGFDPGTLSGGGGGSGDGSGGGKSPIPSDADIEQKNKDWWSRKTGTSNGGKDATKEMGAAPTSNKDGTKIQQAMAAAKDQLRMEGVPEANLDVAASHLVGQALTESHLNPTTVHDQGTGYGVYGARLERRSNMLSWMKQNGFNHDSLEGQIKHMAHEAMSSGYKPTRDALMNATRENFADTAQTITHNFEAPRYENWQKRMDNANRALNTPATVAQSADATPKAEPIDNKNGIRIRPDVFKNGAEALPGADPRINSATMTDLAPEYGKELNDKKKELDDDEIKQPEDKSPSQSNPTNGDRSDVTPADDSFQTTLLETEGPNHFSDYPMSDLGVGA